jgi:uncharacterized protein YjbI with pentapeptide repeats
MLLMSNEPLDPLYAAVFANLENGTPDNIKQAGCLVLARLGREAWNAWRSEYPSKVYGFEVNNAADFSEYDFKKERIHIPFDGFIFVHGANFKNTQFRKANFVGAEFGESANFIGAKLGYSSSFENARFGYGAKFNGAQFLENAIFTSVQFDDHVCFDGAQFCDGTKFNTAKLGNGASFEGAQFGNDTNFEFTEFGISATFVSRTWASLTSQYSECSDKFEVIKAWAEERGLSPEIFKSISFAGANFTDRVDFSGRTFEGHTSFGCINAYWPTKFGKAPLFHNCKLHQDTTFDSAEFPEPSSDPVENDIATRAYRTLKLAFSQHQAIREEQLFFRLEMAEEAAKLAFSQQQTTRKKQSFFIYLLGKAKEILVGIWQFLLVLKKAQNTSHRARICLFFSYKWLSNYGFSFGRPMFLLFLALLVFWGIYAWLADFTPCLLTNADCQIRYDLIQFTLLQALPLSGLDKWSDSLRCYLFPDEGLKSVAFTAALMIHKAISLLAVFLFGLALRNLFKMK